MIQKPQDPFIGARLGDYVIQELVGRGGMARVYRGIDLHLERPAAVKVLQISDQPDDDRLIERFKLEAKAIARFEHPNIVPIYQYGENEDGTQFFIAMKLVEGSTLSKELKANRRADDLIPPERVLEIVRDVCSALDYAHERGIIHRDIKPSNILFEASQGDRAILTDFGLAMEADGGSTLGTAFGTPRYISPEQAMSSQKAVPQSD
ncbi:MAG: serine/threonine protein kinase, partial [Anaerolineae bacterium]|nr:serine/threonine protein kinase [Anaerolineae bacterium]